MKRQKKRKNRKQSFDNFVTKLTSITEFKIPTKFKCPKCSSKMVRISMLFAGPWSGTLKCTKCDWTQGTMQYIGERIISMQPFPEGAHKYINYDGGNRKEKGKL